MVELKKANIFAITKTSKAFISRVQIRPLMPLYLVREKKEQKKAEGKIQNKRPITSELGCVSPILVVPGDWKESEIEYQARHIASMVTHNASFNCNAGKIVVFAKEWPLKEKLKERIAFHLRKKGNRKAYYPGAQDRYEQFTPRYRTEVCGAVKEGEPVVPWTILHDVPAKKTNMPSPKKHFVESLPLQK